MLMQWVRATRPAFYLPLVFHVRDIVLWLMCVGVLQWLLSYSTFCCSFAVSCKLIVVLLTRNFWRNKFVVHTTRLEQWDVFAQYRWFSSHTACRATVLLSALPQESLWRSNVFGYPLPGVSASMEDRYCVPRLAFADSCWLSITSFGDDAESHFRCASWFKFYLIHKPLVQTKALLKFIMQNVAWCFRTLRGQRATKLLDWFRCASVESRFIEMCSLSFGLALRWLYLGVCQIGNLTTGTTVLRNLPCTNCTYSFAMCDL